MNALSITTKLRLAFLGLAAIFLGFGAFSIDRLDKVNALSSEIETSWLPSIVAAGDFNAEITHYRLAELSHVLTTDEAGMRQKEEEMARLKAEVAAGLIAYEPLISSPEERRLHQSFAMDWNAYVAQSEKSLELSRRNANGEAAEALKADAVLFDRLSSTLGQLVTLNQRGGAEASHRGDALFAASRHLILAACAAVVLTALALMVLFERAVSRPVTRITGVIRRLAEGDLSDRIAEVNRGDEIGQLTQAAAGISATLKGVAADLRGMIEAAEAGTLTMRADPSRHRGEYAALVAGVNTLFEVFGKPLNEVAEVMQRVAAGQLAGRMAGSYEGDLRALKANVNRSLDSLCSLLDELGKVAGRLALGDLTTEVAGTYQGEFAAIRGNINDAVGKMRGALTEVSASSDAVAAAATETNAAASEVLRQSSAQMATLMEVSGAVEQTALSVREIAANADRGNRLAGDLARRAEEGRGQLRSLAEAINRIAASNSRIGQISDRIARIAEKTHVLSLNAGIEAARAGEQGWGFGVVAREIGRLAEEVSAAVGDVSALTVEASGNVQGGVAAAGEAQQAMQSITEAARDSEQAAQNIAGAIAQQAAAVQQLSRQAVDLRESGQSNAGAAEQINTTMGNLAEMVHHVAEQIGRFVLAR